VDVAHHAGVSAATVSRVISGGAPVAEETRARVMRAIEELGYRPNIIAQSLRRGRGRTVALVTGDIEQGLHAAVAKAMQATLGEIDLDLLLFDMSRSQERLSHLIQHSASLGLRGLLLATPQVIKTEDLLFLMRTSSDAGMLTLSISQRLDHHGISSIVPDYTAAAGMAVHHLVSRNREPIAYLGRIENSAVGKLRFEGYCQALRRLDRIVDPALMWDVSLRYRFEGGCASVNHALKAGRRFGAVLGASDEVALGGIAAATDYGLRTPDDIAFVGFGGLKWGAYTRPALTTAEQNIEALAAAVGDAFKALSEAREIPLLTMIPPRLVARGST
jgi:DNA-binding LacI/PurR family transcriptional regulator